VRQTRIPVIAAFLQGWPERVEWAAHRGILFAATNPAFKGVLDGRLEGAALRRLDPRRVKAVALEDFLRRGQPMRMAFVLQNLLEHLEGRGDEAGKAQTAASRTWGAVPPCV
jgi:hypothetical protein